MEEFDLYEEAIFLCPYCFEHLHVSYNRIAKGEMLINFSCDNLLHDGADIYVKLQKKERKLPPRVIYDLINIRLRGALRERPKLWRVK